MNVEKRPLGIEIDHDRQLIRFPSDSAGRLLFEMLSRRYPYAPSNKIRELIDPDLEAKELSVYGKEFPYFDDNFFGLMNLAIDAKLQMGQEAFEEFNERVAAFDLEYPRWVQRFLDGEDPSARP